MYGLLWRALPGNRLLKAAQLLVLLGVAAFALIVWGFPFADDLLFSDQAPDIG